MLDVLGQRQQALLHLLLRQKQGMTVDQMAARLGITRTAVREHVAALERERLVAPGAVLPSTGGRPGRRYRLTARGMALFPKQYDLMARLLLESLAQRAGGDAEDELRALGRQLAERLKHRVRGSTLAERTKATAELMRDLGYEASAGADDETPTVEAFNCVYHELASADPGVCALDLSLLENLTDAEVEHRACMARGDDACRFCLKAKPERPQ